MFDSKKRKSKVTNPQSERAFIQPKLKIGAAGDKYEVNADKATQANSTSRVGVQKKEEEKIQQKPLTSYATPFVQAKEEGLMQRAAEEEEVQTKQESIQREEEEEAAQPKRENVQRAEEEEAQTKQENIQRVEEEKAAQPKLEGVQKQEEEGAAQPKLQLAEEEEAQTKLQFKGQPHGSKAVHRVAKSGFMGLAGSYPFSNQIQTSFGNHDISGIKAYKDGAAIKANKSLGAVAYASGENVAFKKAPDLHTAAHEAAHIIQQKQGVQLKGGLGTKNDKYECHADAVADKVVQGRSAEGLLSKSLTGPSGTVNRKPVQFDRNLATEKRAAVERAN